MGASVGTETPLRACPIVMATKCGGALSVIMAEADPELLRLLKAERLAFERCQRLRGYPEDIEAVAQALLTEASQAVRDFRAKTFLIRTVTARR